MSKKTALIVDGIIFAIVAIAHLLRIYYGSEVIVAGYVVPMGLSYVVVGGAAALAIWMFIAS